MGLPGAGKSTVKRRRIRRGDLDIEPDQFKPDHPRFAKEMSKEVDEEVHRWSVRKASEAFEDALRAASRSNIIFDSSGSNWKWLRRHILEAREAGYATDLLWVDVPLEIALLRNRDRAAQGGAWCPEQVIIDKAALMQKSFEELRQVADTAERLQNWCEGGKLELERAKQDLYLYPAPRTRPTSLRPGDPGYGEAPDGACPPSCSAGSRRTIRIGPWKRSEEVAHKKNERLAWIDETFRGNRERFIMNTVLDGREVVVEPNKFPYFLPPDIEHWTIWSRHDMDHRELCDYMEKWLDAREPHNVIAWNYDDNRGRRTIDIWHVHIYFQGADGKLPVFKQSQGLRHTASRSSSHRSPCSV